MDDIIKAMEILAAPGLAVDLNNVINTIIAFIILTAGPAVGLYFFITKSTGALGKLAAFASNNPLSKLAKSGTEKGARKMFENSDWQRGKRIRDAAKQQYKAGEFAKKQEGGGTFRSRGLAGIGAGIRGVTRREPTKLQQTQFDRLKASATSTVATARTKEVEDEMNRLKTKFTSAQGPSGLGAYIENNLHDMDGVQAQAAGELLMSMPAGKSAARKILTDPAAMRAGLNKGGSRGLAQAAINTPAFAKAHPDVAFQLTEPGPGDPSYVDKIAGNNSQTEILDKIGAGANWHKALRNGPAVAAIGEGVAPQYQAWYDKQYVDDPSLNAQQQATAKKVHVDERAEQYRFAQQMSDVTRESADGGTQQVIEYIRQHPPAGVIPAPTPSAASGSGAPGSLPPIPLVFNTPSRVLAAGRPIFTPPTQLASQVQGNGGWSRVDDSDLVELHKQMTVAANNPAALPTNNDRQQAKELRDLAGYHLNSRGYLTTQDASGNANGWIKDPRA